MNEAIEPQCCNFKGMLTLVNLCEDSLYGVELHIPPKWYNLNEVCRLAQDGKWWSIQFEMKGQTLVLKEHLNYLEPMYILVK